MFIALRQASQVYFLALPASYVSAKPACGYSKPIAIPGFDGWQIYRLKASKKVVNALAAVVLIALILNVVPWLWSL